MNDILKQRLVGALILVALGIVFWPIIFVEPGDRAALEQSRIPLPPRIDRSPIEPPQQGALRASPQRQPDTAGLSEQQVPETMDDTVDRPAVVVNPDAEPSPVAAPAEASRTRAGAPQKPALDDRAMPVAWILQVASVSNVTKAEELRDRLLAKHEKAYVKRIKRGGKDLYRVAIGPNFERARLEGIQASVDAQFGVKSMIVRYLP